MRERNEGESRCPDCGFSCIVGTSEKRKIRTRVLIFSDNGEAMGICPRCKTQLRLPIVLQDVDT